MIQLEIFDDVFAFDPRYSYPRTLQNEINNHRSTLQKLFFDRLLETLHINASHLYPPHNNSDLRNLHKEIVSAPIADHLKQSVLYYILKDCKSQTEVEPAEAFARACFIPDKYSICILGLWHMDREHFERSLDYLTAPSLVPTFPSEILSVLLTQTANTALHHLPLTYYHTVSLPLTSLAVISSFLAYLTSVSVTDAYFFLRQQPSNLHKELLETLVDTALSGPPNDDKATRGVELVSLPLSEEEEGWMEEFLEGRGRNLSGAAETVMVRRAATGRVREAVEGRGAGGSGRKSGQWEQVRDGLRRGLGPRTVPDAIMMEGLEGLK